MAEKAKQTEGQPMVMLEVPVTVVDPRIIAQCGTTWTPFDDDPVTFEVKYGTVLMMGCRHQTCLDDWAHDVAAGYWGEDTADAHVHPWDAPEDFDGTCILEPREGSPFLLVDVMWAAWHLELEYCAEHYPLMPSPADVAPGWDPIEKLM